VPVPEAAWNTLLWPESVSKEVTWPENDCTVSSVTLPDTDSGQSNVFQAASGTGTSSYGSYSVGTDGNWTYNLANGNALCKGWAQARA